jgi:hypothetical protein
MASTEPDLEAAVAAEPEAPAEASTEPLALVVDESALELELPEPEPPKKRGFPLHLKLPRIRIHVSAARLKLALFVVVALAFVGGLAALIWFLAVPLFFRVVLHRAPPAVAVQASPAPKPSPTPTFAPLPAEAPAITDGLDMATVYPFAKRLALVNRLAGRKIVTTAEFHDSDAGARYYTAIVTSCKDLESLWPIKNGSLDKITARFRLTEFDKFVFVQRDSEGQWGMISCDGST